MCLVQFAERRELTNASSQAGEQVKNSSVLLPENITVNDNALLQTGLSSSWTSLGSSLTSSVCEQNRPTSEWSQQRVIYSPLVSHGISFQRKGWAPCVGRPCLWGLFIPCPPDMLATLPSFTLLAHAPTCKAPFCLFHLEFPSSLLLIPPGMSLKTSVPSALCHKASPELSIRHFTKPPSLTSCAAPSKVLVESCFLIQSSTYMSICSS